MQINKTAAQPSRENEKIGCLVFPKQAIFADQRMDGQTPKQHPIRTPTWQNAA